MCFRRSDPRWRPQHLLPLMETLPYVRDQRPHPRPTQHRLTTNPLPSTGTENDSKSVSRSDG